MNTHTSSTDRPLVPVAQIEREMIIAGIVWIIVGAFCVVAANLWVAGA
jgi:hypothetical protein